MESLALWALVLIAAGVFAVQVSTRIRLIVAAPQTLVFDQLGTRARRWLVDVLGQRQTIRERPVAGAAHAIVFWGFLAFSLYTAAEFLRDLSIVDLTTTPWFHAYRILLTPVALGVLSGIVFLAIRRGIVRPPALGRTVSAESLLVAVLIATLMVTFLLTWRFEAASLAGRVNTWTHAVVILAFLALIPASKHFHLVLSPVTVFFKSTELGSVPNLDFEKEQVGLETLKDVGSKSVLDALTCVECGRCQDSCPAYGAGKALNPKTLILQTQDALLAGQREARLVDIYSAEVLWQCTSCGACENQCPVGIEHLPLIIGARRGVVSNGDAPAYMAGVYNDLERRGNIWGLTSDQRQKFVDQAGLEIFDPRVHDVLVWLGCAGAFEATFQKSLRSLFEILRAYNVRFGVLAKERCTGDPAKRTGNEYLFQELATSAITDLRAAGPKKILTSCPHCVKTIGADYRRFGYEVEIVHSAVFVEQLTRGATRRASSRDERDADRVAPADDTVTYHDPCYLSRYAGHVEEPRELLRRFGGTVAEPERNRDNPYCCGAGGGLLFADKEEEPGSRISDIRFRQLRETGASTVVTACPFCSIMLKGAQASAPTDAGAPEIQFVDLMSFVNGRLERPHG